MRSEAVGKYLVFNGEIEEVGEINHFEEIKTSPLYEVVTVIDGVPLFFEEHMDRLVRTAHMLDINLSRSVEEIRRDFYRLIGISELENSFIKLIIYEDNYLVYEFTDNSPSQEDLERGVKVSIFDYERENPNAKLLYNDFKTEVKNYLKQTKTFEAILRTEDGELLEGSRTNLYFTKGDKVITAPDDRVLKGITRTRLEKILANKNIETEKKIIRDIDLVDVDGAFITGTTVGIVPIKAIETIELNSQDNKIVKEILEGFRELQQKYVEENKI